MNAPGFAHLIPRLRWVAAALPDRLTGDPIRFDMANLARSALAVFFSQCPSFLSFQQARDQAFDRTGLLQQRRAVGNTRLLPLDATWYCSAQANHIHCPNCSSLRHTEGPVTHFHSAITPVVLSPA